MLKKRLSSVLINFRQWSGVSYGAFSSIGKIVKICALSAIYFMSIQGVKAQEKIDTNAISNIKIDEVVVSASKAPKMLSELARMVEVIPTYELKSSPAQSLNDLLEHSLNIDIRQRGASDIQSDLSFRGGSFNQSLVLLNGAKLIATQTGHHSLDIPINFESIDRIELLHGSGEKFFGVNSTNGAINIITNPKKSDNLQLNYSGGEHEFRNVSMSTNLSIGGLNNFVSFSNKKSDGYIHNTDFETHNMFVVNSYESKFGQFFLQNGYSKKEFGANSFYGASWKNQYEETKTFFSNLQYSYDLNESVHIKNSTSYRLHEDEFQLYRESAYDASGVSFKDRTDTIPGWYKAPNYHKSQNISNEFTLGLESFLGKTFFSYEYRNSSILSNKIGSETLKNPEKIPGVARSKAEYTQEAKRENHALVFEHSVDFENFGYSGGFLHNISDDYGSATNFGFDSYVKYGKNRLFASVNHSLRLPTFTELYYTVGRNVANPNLEAEKSFGYEMGYSYQSTKIQLNSALFYRESDNQIDWIMDQSSFGDTKYHSINYGNFDAWGYEFSTKYFLSENIFMFKYAYNELNLDKNKDVESLYVEDYLKNKLSFSGKHKIKYNFAVAWVYSWQDRNGSYENDKAQLVEYDSFSLVDLRLSWEPANYVVYLESSNLFDEKYRDFGHLIQPGRWIKAGIKFRIEL